MKITITEARAEQLADLMIWRRLDTDRLYNNAKDAETQSDREDVISAGVWRELESKYNIT